MYSTALVTTALLLVSKCFQISWHFIQAVFISNYWWKPHSASNQRNHMDIFGCTPSLRPISHNQKPLPNQLENTHFSLGGYQAMAHQSLGLTEATVAWYEHRLPCQHQLESTNFGYIYIQVHDHLGLILFRDSASCFLTVVKRTIILSSINDLVLIQSA